MENRLDLANANDLSRYVTWKRIRNQQVIGSSPIVGSGSGTSAAFWFAKPAKKGPTVQSGSRTPFCSVLTGWCLIVAIAAPPLPGAADAVSVRPYTSPDKMASARVPAGWTVVRGDHSVIALAGPHGEKVSLGVTVIVLNAGPGARPPTSTAGVAFNLPYATDIKDKFVAIWQYGAAAKGHAAPQFTFATGTLLRVAPILGQCARASGSVGDDSDVPAKFETVMCSLPPDFGGAYKNIIIYAQVPASLAAQERALVEAVMKSYRVPRAILAKKLGPVYATPRIPVGAMGGSPAIGGAPAMGSIWSQARAADTAADCLDLGVIREIPDNELPVKCGGSGPND